MEVKNNSIEALAEVRKKRAEERLEPETPEAEFPCYHCKGKGMEMWGDIKLSCWRCRGTGRMTKKLAEYRKWEEERSA